MKFFWTHIALVFGASPIVVEGSLAVGHKPPEAVGESQIVALVSKLFSHKDGGANSDDSAPIVNMLSQRVPNELELSGELERFRKPQPRVVDTACNQWKMIKASTSDGTRAEEFLNDVFTRYCTGVNQTQSYDPVGQAPIRVRDIGVSSVSHGKLEVPQSGEKRITAYMVAETMEHDNLSSTFENFLSDYEQKARGTSLSGGSAATPRMRNTLFVNQRKEELSISAGLDGVYSFTHYNHDANSIFIVLYLGKNRDFEFGHELLKEFREYLKAKKYVVTNYLVATSDDEMREEQQTIKVVEDHANAIAKRETQSLLARFVIELICASK